MNGDFRTRINGPTGNVHSGDGDQITYINVSALLDPSALRETARERRRRSFATEELTRLEACFVTPEGLGVARGMLERQRTTLLVGERGVGRRSAALKLLWEVRRSQGRLHELDIAPSGKDEPVLDPDLVEEGDRLLLDLTVATEEQAEELLGRLPDFHTDVLERQAFLAVAVPLDRRHLIPPRLTRLTAPLKPPDLFRVLRKHLVGHDVTVTAAELDRADLRDHLRQAVPGQAAELADAIARARERLSGGGFPDWLTGALTELAPRGSEVASLVKRLADGGELALFLATAFLNGARADLITRASENMLKVLEHPGEDTPILDRTALKNRLDAFHATADEYGRATVNARLASAARDHFWNNYPGLGAALVPWARDTVSQNLLTPQDRHAFVRRYADQCLRTGNPEILGKLIDQWIALPPTGPRVSAAGRALSIGAAHEVHGGFFRQRLYDWSRTARLHPTRAHLLVRVCEEVVAVDRPEQAMVRLLHLARRQSGHSDAGGADARRALLGLAARDNRLYRRLLLRLTADPAVQDTVGSRLFLAMPDPQKLTDGAHRTQPLISDRRMRAHLSLGWGRALRDLPPQEWGEQLDTWLSHAAREFRSQSVLLDVLVMSSAQHGPTLGLLYKQVRNWSARASDDGELLEKFWAKCAEFLGFDGPRPSAQEFST